MRYLKVIAQDRSYSGRPDTVVLQFCATVAGSKEAVINNAYALDINEDGDIDVCLGDVTNNELESTRDHQLLSKFAGAYLKFNWFSSGLASMRYMHIFTEDFYKDGTPDTVRLHLYKGFGPITKKHGSCGTLRMTSITTGRSNGTFTLMLTMMALLTTSTGRWFNSLPRPT